MSSKIHLSVLSILIWVLCSCVKVIDLRTPNYTEKNVLNCILNPDSIITVQLTKSIPINDPTRLSTVLDANVFCYENDSLIGKLSFSGQNYYLNYKPKPSKNYKIEAFTPDGMLISGEDYVPNMPLVNIETSFPIIQNINNNPDIYLSVSGIDTSRSRIWFSAYMKLFSADQRTLRIQNQVVESSNSFLDTFNSSMSGSSVKRDWNFYVRLNPSLISNNASFIFNTFNPTKDIDKIGENLSLQFISGSTSFDQYLKSYIIAFDNRLVSNENGLNNPFAELTPVYSNVKNGLGVVIGYNSKVFLIIEGNK
jgi:hypothetical protein